MFKCFILINESYWFNEEKSWQNVVNKETFSLQVFQVTFAY